jgi:hypothetical protein
MAEVDVARRDRQHGDRTRPERGSTGRARAGSGSADRSRLALAGLVVAVLASSLILAGVVGWTLYDRDLVAVATVDGASVSRADLRDRVKLEAALAVRLLDALDADRAAGRLDPGAAAAAGADAGATLADPVAAALRALVDERWIAAQAAERGLAVPDADPAGELEAAFAALAARTVRWIRLRQGTGSATALAAVVETITRRLGEGATLDALRSDAAAWFPEAAETAIDLTGPVAHDTPATPGAELVIAARGATTGTVLGPFDAGDGEIELGLVVGETSGRPGGATLLDRLVTTDGVKRGAIEAWARGQVLRRTLAAAIALGPTDPIDQVRASELVVGPLPGSGTSGTFIELDHLVLDRLPADAIATIVDQAGPIPPTPTAASPAPSPSGGATPRPTSPPSPLREALTTLPATERLAAWATLVGRANAGSIDDPLARSGPIGFFTDQQLTPALSALLFDPVADAGTVVGPVTTRVGEELFLVQSRFVGTLDERTIGALLEARLPGADQEALATRFDPGDAARVAGGPWRARSEFGATDDPGLTLFTAPVGTLVDTLVLDGRVVVPTILERRTATPTARQLAVDALDGFARWLAEGVGAAEVWLSPDPLPELGSRATPSPEPTDALAPRRSRVRRAPSRGSRRAPRSSPRSRRRRWCRKDAGST